LYVFVPDQGREYNLRGLGGQTFERTVRSFQRALADRAKKRSNSQSYMLFDLLHDLRNWGNYVDIDNMVALRSSGFRAYLDQDLHIIVFFFSAIAELTAIALLGAERVTKLAANFYRGFVERDATLWRSPSRLPFDVRFAIYEHLGRREGQVWQPNTAPPLAPPVEFV
jgi:hypothetical protein